MATHCSICGARHFQGDSANVAQCRECAPGPMGIIAAIEAIGTTKNTCEAAFDLLAKRPDTIFRSATGALELRRKIAAPGQLSDGTRTFIIRPCERIRWLVVELGWKTLAEVDQRSFGNDAEAMAAAVMAAIDAQTPKTAAPAPYREELTATGLQYVIPGCERVPALDKNGTAQLSLF